MDTRGMRNILLHKMFEVAILLKGVFGIIEIFVGAFILLVNRAAVSDFLLYLVHGELVEDPMDPFGIYIQDLSQNLSASTETFIGWYFFAYGLVKILVILGLIRNKLWAYRTALAVLSLFVAYMVYRFVHTHSAPLAALIIMDIATVGLIWREYAFLKENDARKDEGIIEVHGDRVNRVSDS